MLTVHRRPGHLIDRGTGVIVDLPHAADTPARPHLCSLMKADTHEQVTGVLGMSMHFDIDAANGDRELWAVAEQLVDEYDAPLPPGAACEAVHHPEYFRGTLRTALFHYRIAGFTTGPRFDRASTWHRDLGADTKQSDADTKPNGLTEFEVSFTNGTSTRVHALYFEYADGFVAFYGGGWRAAAYRTEQVFGVRTVPDRRVLVVDDEQLRILRSAVLWDAERVADSEAADGYRERLRSVLADVLGVTPPAPQDADACAAPAETAAHDADDGPYEHVRQAVGRLDAPAGAC